MDLLTAKALPPIPEELAASPAAAALGPPAGDLVRDLNGRIIFDLAVAPSFLELAAVLEAMATEPRASNSGSSRASWPEDSEPSLQARLGLARGPPCQCASHLR